MAMIDFFKESEDKCRSLFSNMLNGFAYCKMIYDKRGQPVDFVYLEVNNAFERLTGLKREQVLGKKVTEAIPGIMQATPELFKIYGRVAKTGNGEKFEIYFSPLKIWLNILVYSPEKGYFAAIFDNITERKNAEEELKKSEHLLKTIMDNAQDAVYLKDRRSRVLFANAETLKIFGKPLWSVIGKTERDLHEDKEVGRAIVETDRTVVETGKSLVAEETLVTQQGKRIFLTKKSPWLDADGKVVGLISIARDITERKRLEQELNTYNQRLEEVVAQRTSQYIQAIDKLTREIEERRKTEEGLALRAAILDNTGEAIFLINLKGDFIYANEAALKMYGYTRDEFLGMNVRQLLQHEEASQVEPRLKKVADMGQFRHESIHVAKDKTLIPVVVQHSLIKTAHGQFIVSAMHDARHHLQK